MLHKAIVALVMISSNAYVFLSGVLISLATNLFVTISIDQTAFSQQWAYYLSAILFILAGALCMYISAKVGDVQKYLLQRGIMSPEQKLSFFDDTVKSKKRMWHFRYIVLLILLIVGFASLALG